MKSTIHEALLVFGFAALVAGAVTATTFRGETREAAGLVDCTAAVWPRIPAACLHGGPGRDVRFVTADIRMEDRFSAAFE